MVRFHCPVHRQRRSLHFNRSYTFTVTLLLAVPIPNSCPCCLSVSLFPVFPCLPLRLPSHPGPLPLSKDSAGPKIEVACLVRSSTTLVWCTVSTKLERDAEPSVVLSNVGPNTKHNPIIKNIEFKRLTYCEVASGHVVCL